MWTRNETGMATTPPPRATKLIFRCVRALAMVGFTVHP
jgi:hypothetical protein